jgi:myo-inositol-1(or 4)-monophosphatase
MGDEQRQEYLEFAKKLALEAGDIMRKYFLITDTTWKPDDTPLTQADTEINSLVIRRINDLYPSHSILGEEESDIKDSRYVWVCDPVDGTMPYSHGLPISTFSLALCDDGVPQVGVVYDPFMKRLFWASVGGGAYCNNGRIQVNQQHLKDALIDVEVGQNASPNDAITLGSGFRGLLEDAGVKHTGLWSCILPTCLVANGNFGAVVQNGKAPHDIAASKVIVEEAGGIVTNIVGNDQRYDQPTKGFIASNGVIHEELVKLVEEASDEI